jgi:hypothetical protein
MHTRRVLRPPDPRGNRAVIVHSSELAIFVERDAKHQARARGDGCQAVFDWLQAEGAANRHEAVTSAEEHGIAMPAVPAGAADPPLRRRPSRALARIGRKRAAGPNGPPVWLSDLSIATAASSSKQC